MADLLFPENLDGFSIGFAVTSGAKPKVIYGTWTFDIGVYDTVKKYNYEKHFPDQIIHVED